MKLSKTLSSLGRTVAYYPKLKKITGSTTATIMFCQLFYWHGKGRYKNSWIYKTAEQIEEETGLSYKEQKTARKLLIASGLVEESYSRLDHKMLFRVNIDKMDELVDK